MTKPRRHPLDCKHGVGTEAIQMGRDGRQQGGFTHWLCGWGKTLTGRRAVKDAPPWMEREVLGGHLLRPTDCAGCAAFQQRRGT